MTTINKVKIEIDPAKLLGFSSASGDSTKIGAKAGNKVGGKVGAKVGGKFA